MFSSPHFHTHVKYIDCETHWTVSTNDQLDASNEMTADFEDVCIINLPAITAGSIMEVHQRTIRPESKGCHRLQSSHIIFHSRGKREWKMLAN